MTPNLRKKRTLLRSASLGLLLFTIVFLTSCSNSASDAPGEWVEHTYLDEKGRAAVIADGTQPSIVFFFTGAG